MEERDTRKRNVNEKRGKVRRKGTERKQRKWRRRVKEPERKADRGGMRRTGKLMAEDNTRERHKRK